MYPTPVRRSRPSSAGGVGGVVRRDSLSSSHPSILPSSASASNLESPSSSRQHHQHQPPPSSQRERPRDRDRTELNENVRHLKELLHEREQENLFLKTQLQRILSQTRKKDKQIEQITSLKLSALSDPSGDSIIIGQLRELRSEMTQISRLNEKFRSLEGELYLKNEQLRRSKHSIKQTQTKELEMEAQVYYNEARRTRKQLQAAQGQIKALESQLALYTMGGGAVYSPNRHSAVDSFDGGMYASFSSPRVDSGDSTSRLFARSSPSSSAGAASRTSHSIHSPNSPSSSFTHPSIVAINRNSAVPIRQHQLNTRTYTQTNTIPPSHTQSPPPTTDYDQQPHPSYDSSPSPSNLDAEYQVHDSDGDADAYYGGGNAYDGGYTYGSAER